jgi:hypothetical protein
MGRLQTQGKAMASMYESAVGAASVVVIKAARMIDNSIFDRLERTMELTGIAGLISYTLCVVCSLKRTQFVLEYLVSS